MQNTNEAGYYQKGQILLIVVLTMVVALTVGLSVASRIVTELRISSQNEESQKAFQAAEAGIQQSLRQDSDITLPVNLGSGTTFTSELEKSEGGTIFVNAGLDVDQDTGADVWLSKYNPDPSLNFGSPISGQATLYWGSPGQVNCNNTTGSGNNDPTVVPAIEVIILDGSGPGGELGIKKYVYEANGCGRIPGANSSVSAGGDTLTDISGESKEYLYKSDLTNPLVYAEGRVMKVIPIYNSTEVALVSSGALFPEQGKTVISTGTSGSTQRRIKYYTSLPQLPIEVFPYSILSQ